MRHWWLAVAVMGCVLLGCAAHMQSDIQPHLEAPSPPSTAGATPPLPFVDPVLAHPNAVWAVLPAATALEAACRINQGPAILEQERPCIAEWVKKLPPLDPQRRDLFGVEYNPAKYLDCRLKVGQWASSGCEHMVLRRYPQPEYWPYPEVAKPKLPEAPQPPVYREGMSAEEYFHALCKVEAGEFIYRVVENVEGLYQIRPRRQAGYGVMNDLYVLEDPYGYTVGELVAGTTQVFVRPPTANYKFLEWPAAALSRTARDEGGKPYVHEYGTEASLANPPPKREFVSKLKARYGYTWREIKRPKDRENGISGGELIVVDLRTNEVLGIRRGFARTGIYSHRIGMANWESTQVCPYRVEGKVWAKDWDFAYWFISKVLKPAE